MYRSYGGFSIVGFHALGCTTSQMSGQERSWNPVCADTDLSKICGIFWGCPIFQFNFPTGSATSTSCKTAPSKHWVFYHKQQFSRRIWKGVCCGQEVARSCITIFWPFTNLWILEIESIFMETTLPIIPPNIGCLFWNKSAGCWYTNQVTIDYNHHYAQALCIFSFLRN